MTLQGRSVPRGGLAPFRRASSAVVQDGWRRMPITGRVGSSAARVNGDRGAVVHRQHLRMPTTGWVVPPAARAIGDCGTLVHRQHPPVSITGRVGSSAAPANGEYGGAVARRWGMPIMGAVTRGQHGWLPITGSRAWRQADADEGGGRAPGDAACRCRSRGPVPLRLRMPPADADRGVWGPIAGAGRCPPVDPDLSRGGHDPVFAPCPRRSCWRQGRWIRLLDMRIAARRSHPAFGQDGGRAVRRIGGRSGIKSL